jgi:hypothetical protein
LSVCEKVAPMASWRAGLSGDSWNT